MSGGEQYEFAIGEEITVWLTGFSAQRAVVTGTPDTGYGMYTVAIEFPATEHQMRHKTAAAIDGNAGQGSVKTRKRSPQAKKHRPAAAVSATRTTENEENERGQ